MIVNEMYSGLKAKIITDKEGRLLNIKKRGQTRDSLSPLLFNCVLQEVFRGLDWEGKGLNINGGKITNLRFANDVVLLANNEIEITNMTEDICKHSEVAGLTINTDKTVILAKKDGLLRLRESKEEIKIVNETTYLGQLITLDCGIEKETEIRISKAWGKYWSLGSIFKGPFSLDQKS